jgi:hypothetical protein
VKVAIESASEKNKKKILINRFEGELHFMPPFKKIINSRFFLDSGLP